MFVLGPNQLQRFYQGGAEIAGFRGLGAAADGPEDWVASVTTAFGEQRAGLSPLPDGRTLAEAIAEQPEWFLGAEHVAAYGTDTGLLVKLLDAGQRLPVHCHPDQAYSRAHLGCSHGKTEAWIVLTTSGEDACVYLGFRDDIPAGVLAAGWPARTCPHWSARCTGSRSPPGTACWCRPAPRMPSAPVCSWPNCRNRPTCPSCWSGVASWTTAPKLAVSAWATRLCSRPWTAPGGARTGWPGCAGGRNHLSRVAASPGCSRPPPTRSSGPNCSGRTDISRCRPATRCGSWPAAPGPWPPSTAARCRCAAA